MKRLAVWVCVLTAFSASVSASPDDEHPSKIVVVGAAEALLEPDYIEWVVDIRTRDEVPRIAREANHRIFELLLDIAKKANIDKSDISRGEVSYEQQFRVNSGNPPDIDDYSRTNVHRRVVLVMRDMDELDEMIDAVHPLGVIYAVHRKSSRYDETMRRIKAQALKDARQKAVEQATALGQNVGKAIDVEVTANPQTPRPWASFGSAEPVEVEERAADASGRVRLAAYAYVSFRLD